MKKALYKMGVLSLLPLTTLPGFAYASEEGGNIQEEPILEEVVVSNSDSSSMAGGVSRASIKCTTTATIHYTLAPISAASSATGEAAKMMDSIFVRSRLYNSNGGLKNDKSSTKTKTAYNSVKTNHAPVSVSKNYTYANSTFKKSGYSTVTHEVRANQ